MAPTQPIPLPLRNALAALALRALDDDAAHAAVVWVATPTRNPDEHVARVLVEVGLADPPGCRLLEMYVPHAPHAQGHAARVVAARRAVDAGPLPTDRVDRALLGAVALWRSGLYFEVHEILEPHWARATGARREALQGLIQMAVAFHHVAHGNLRGARKLLGDGREKLEATGSHLTRIDTTALLVATTPWMNALAARDAQPDEPIPPLTLRERPPQP